MAFQIWTFEFWWVEATAHKEYDERIDKPDRVCEGCIFRKQHKETFPVGNSYRVCTPLEIVHYDICGPMQTMSIGGSK